MLFRIYNALYVLVLGKQTSFKQTFKTVSAKRRITQIIAQWVPGRQQMPDAHTSWDCVEAQRGNDAWQNEDVVDWPHQRLQCSSPSNTRNELCDEGKGSKHHSQLLMNYTAVRSRKGLCAYPIGQSERCLDSERDDKRQVYHWQDCNPQHVAPNQKGV